MSSERKLRSARANGAKAQGTKTPEGIMRSAANAITHGLTCSNIVVANESAAQFQILRESCLRELDPQTQLEADLVEELIAARWRLARVRGLEAGLLDLEMVKQEEQIREDFETLDGETRLAIAFRTLADDSRALGLLNRYEARFHRVCQRVLESLRFLRQDRDSKNEKLQNDPNPKNEHSVETVVDSL
jgi:hypothetical protein